MGFGFVSAHRTAGRARTANIRTLACLLILLAFRPTHDGGDSSGSRYSPFTANLKTIRIHAVDHYNIALLVQKGCEPKTPMIEALNQHRDLANTRYPDYCANLVVSSRSINKGESALVAAEAARLQRPCGGVTCVGKPGSLSKKERGALPGAGSWTHQYADPANTVCSNDQLVRGRLRMLWFRDVDFNVANRHGRAPAPLCHQGRLIYAGLHCAHRFAQCAIRFLGATAIKQFNH